MKPLNQSPSIERSEAPYQDIVVIYHDQCRDGLGAAYAAWKKFGLTASYIPLKHQAELPAQLVDKEIYIVDFSFSLEVLTELRNTNASVVVIDHHQSAQAAVTSFPENIFDLTHSGAVLSWRYFHGDTPVPPLLEYVEDHDIWKFSLPHNREYCAALGLHPMTFASWDQLITTQTNGATLREFIATGTAIAQFEDQIVAELLTYKERVLFAGYECYAVNIARTYRSIVGHHLAKLNQEAGGVPLGIVYYRNLGGVNISLRSEGEIDVATIAEAYGGGGHKHAASIRVASFAELPFTFLPE